VDKEAQGFEREAINYLVDENYSQAFKLYTKAAKAYDKEGSNQKAVLCYASAASSWSKNAGEKTFLNSAISFKKAAKKSGLTISPLLRRCPKVKRIAAVTTIIAAQKNVLCGRSP